jgi:ribosomal protein L40E
MEGTATLYNSTDDSTVDVTAGQKIAVSGEGEFGSVQKFSENELSDELVGLLKTATLTDDASTSSDSTVISMPPGMGGQSVDEIESIEHSEDWAGVTSDDDAGSDSNVGTYLTYGGVVIVAVFLAAIIIRNSRRRQRERVVYVAATPTMTTMPLPPQPATITETSCSNCGAQLPIGVLYCNKCGSKMPTDTIQNQTHERIFCTQCGMSNPGNSRFCKRCGLEIEP